MPGVLPPGEHKKTASIRERFEKRFNYNEVSMTNTAEIIKFPDKQITQGREYVKADTDNGYYRVANELGLALCKVRLSDRESRLVHAVMIKTFGWQKGMDWICYDQLSELTGIDITNIGKTKTALVKRNIFLVAGKKLGINPIVSEWENKSEPTQKTKNKISQNRLMNKSEPTQKKVETDSVVSQNRLTQKKDTITKDTITKDIDKTPVPPRIKKPEQFKRFFNLYPAHRKGGTQANAWKAWKSEKLTETDAQAALDWITLAAKNNSDWETLANGQYVFGITNFIRDKKWLTPAPQPMTQNNNRQSVEDHNQEAMNQWLASHPQNPEVEVNPNER